MTRDLALPIVHALELVRQREATESEPTNAEQFSAIEWRRSPQIEHGDLPGEPKGASPRVTGRVPACNRLK